MTDDAKQRELRFRSEAAAALRYTRPDSAKPPSVDTSSLWDEAPVTAVPHVDRGEEKTQASRS